MNKTTRKWDANWDRLRLETKIDKLRQKLLDLEIETEREGARAYSAARAALYVANK